MMEPKKRGEDTDRPWEAKFGFCTLMTIVGVAKSSSGVLAVLLVYSTCTTLALVLVSFPPTVTPQRLTIMSKKPGSYM